MGVCPAGSNASRVAISLLRRTGSYEATRSTHCFPCDIIWHTHILLVPPALAPVGSTGITSGPCQDVLAADHATTLVEVRVFFHCLLGRTLRSQLPADGASLSMAHPGAGVDCQVLWHSPSRQ